MKHQRERQLIKDLESHQVIKHFKETLQHKRKKLIFLLKAVVIHSIGGEVKFLKVLKLSFSTDEEVHQCNVLSVFKPRTYTLRMLPRKTTMNTFIIKTALRFLLLMLLLIDV